ncbi:expressed unknown protein [Seminavis robusta]|uniref:Uncharacterized protein n=1 Tax=Seminavis robusta TaxID=568900 RepID=A0A9N8DBT0_9STRA|nr:expressed unknown protein [Seminavis robusta]|eukprot:Sro49_g028850.1 n/a (1129) ;mRNA; r:133256-136913
MTTTTAFPYTNPYSNPYSQRRGSLSSQQSSAQQKFQQKLEALARSSCVPSTQTVEQLCDLQSRCENDGSLWSLSTAEGLATFVIRTFGCLVNIDTSGQNPQGYPATLSFLARCLDQWSQSDESIIYTASTKVMEIRMDNNLQQSFRMSLLQTLHNLVVYEDWKGNDRAIRNVAMVCLSIIWQNLDRIQRLISWKCYNNTFPSHSIEAVWWIPASNEEKLATVAVKGLLSDDKDLDFSSSHIYPRGELLKTAYISVLICLLKHDKTSWLHHLALQDQDTLSHLSQTLLGAMHQLNNQSLTSRYTLHASFASVALLVLMDHKVTLDISNQLNQLFYSTKLLDSVFQAYFGVLGASSPSGPRWTYEHKDDATGRWMEDFIVVWSQCKDSSTRQLAFDALERHWKPHVEQGWTSFLTEDYCNPDEVARKHKHCASLLSRLVLLYSVHHSSLRNSLFSSMAQHAKSDETSVSYLVQPCQRLVKTLQHLSFHPDNSIALCAASFTKALLSERGSLLLHQDVVERAIDRKTVDAFLMGVVKLVKRQGSQTHLFRPLLLILLDVVDLMLSLAERIGEAIHLVDSELTEVFISLMTPKEIRIDQAGAFLDTSNDTTIMEDSETDTPPANNLSRLDERSICIEKEEEEPASTCNDHFIRMAAATILSRFGFFEIDNQLQKGGEIGLRLVQNRIRKAVPDFFATLGPTKSMGGESASFENLSMDSMESRRRYLRLLTAMATAENEEFLASNLLASDQCKEREIERLQEKINSVESKLQESTQRETQLCKEKEEIKRKMDNQAVRFWKEAQRMKKSEQLAAESKIGQFDTERKIAERRVTAMSRELQDTQDRAREADRAAKASCEAEAKTREELHTTIEQMNTLRKESAELKRQAAERDAAVRGMKERLTNLEKDQGTLQELLSNRDETIGNLNKARDKLETNLDNVFSDLVKLCEMYEVLEGQAEDRRIARDELSKQLDEERIQKKETEQRMAKEKEQLQNDTKALEQKLTRYKEKIEKYRAERQTSAHAHTKSSLHDSSSHRSSLRSNSNSRHGSSRSSRTTTRGKENNGYAYESQQIRPRQREKERGSESQRYATGTSRRQESQRDAPPQKDKTTESQRRIRTRDEEKYSTQARYYR